MGIFHSACGVLALALGARIFLAAKGTTAHAWMGRTYVGAMLGLNLSAFGIYHLTGGFNLFHLLAGLSLATLAVGWLQVLNRRRWRKWLWRHYQYMSWSYVGLVAATSNEAFVRLAPLKRLTAETTSALPLIALAGILVLAAILVRAKQTRTLALYGSSSTAPQAKGH